MSEEKMMVKVGTKDCDTTDDDEESEICDKSHQRIFILGIQLTGGFSQKMKNLMMMTPLLNTGMMASIMLTWRNHWKVLLHLLTNRQM